MKGLKIDVEEESQDYTVTRSGTFRKGVFALNNTWKDLRLEDFRRAETLGQGASGIVHRAYHKSNPGLVLALKEISVVDRTNRDQIVKELEALLSARSPWLVGFFGAFYNEGSIILALEYMDGGSLYDVCSEMGAIPEPVLAIIIFQVLKGLQYLHKERRMVHRDLKSANILMNRQGDFKITDFGVSSKLENTCEKCRTFVGTVTYMSPERLEGAMYSFEGDVWSLGITIVECATGRSPFIKDGRPINGFWELLNAIKTHGAPLLSPRHGFSAELCDFVTKCLYKRPNARATVTELLCHPWIAKNVPRDFPHTRPDAYVRFCTTAARRFEARRRAKASTEANAQTAAMLANLRF